MAWAGRAARGPYLLDGAMRGNGGRIAGAAPGSAGILPAARGCGVPPRPDQ